VKATGVVIVLVLLLLPLTCRAALILNIDAQKEYWKRHGVGQDLFWFEAGAYSVKPVNKSSGGTYTAWSHFCGDVRNCSSNGICERGFSNSYAFYTEALGWADLTVVGGRVDLNSSIYFATEELAFNRAMSAQFNLDEAGYMRFFVFDQDVSYRDNLGGVSLTVTTHAIPALGTIYLFGIGVIALVWFRLRRETEIFYVRY